MAPVTALPKPQPQAPCKGFYSTGVCEDEQCRATKLHSEVALRVGLQDGALLKASMLAAAFSFFRPIAAVVSNGGAEGVVVFGNAEDLKNALKWQNVRISPFASPLPPASSLAQPVVAAAASPDTGEDAPVATAPAVAAPAAAVDAAPVKRKWEKSKFGSKWCREGFVWSKKKNMHKRGDGSCRWNRPCGVKGCRAMRVIECDADGNVELDKTSPPHNHEPPHRHEIVISDGTQWIATRVVVQDRSTIKSLRCPTPDCYARRRVKWDAEGKLVSEENWGMHLHSREEREAESNKEAVELTMARDREEDAETMTILRNRQMVRPRRKQDDGFEWKALGTLSVGDGREARFQCTACEAVRVVRWNVQLEVEYDETALAHSHPNPTRKEAPEDGYVWEAQKVTVSATITERTFACQGNGCTAIRTLRWNVDGTVASDVTEPEHVHLAQQEKGAKPAQGKRKGLVRWARKRADGFAWRVTRDVSVPNGRESVFVCVTASCPAVRTVRWGADLKVVSDVTEPRHTHLPPDHIDAGDEAKQRVGINWAPMAEDGFAWTKRSISPLPTGLECTFGCSKCEAVRTVRWNLETLEVEADVTDRVHTHEADPTIEKKRPRDAPREKRIVWRYKKYDGFAWKQARLPLLTEDGGRKCTFHCSQCPSSRTVVWNASREIVSDVTVPEHTHAGLAVRRAGRPRKVAAEGGGEPQESQLLVDDKVEAEQADSLPAEQETRKKAKIDRPEQEEYNWTLRFEEDDNFFYKCNDCEARRLVVLNSEKEVVMDVTEPQHTHGPPAKSEEEKPEAPVLNGLNCAVGQTILRNDELQVVSDVTEPPRTQSLEPAMKKRRKKKQQTSATPPTSRLSESDFEGMIRPAVENEVRSENVAGRSNSLEIESSPEPNPCTPTKVSDEMDLELPLPAPVTPAREENELEESPSTVGAVPEADAVVFNGGVALDEPEPDASVKRERLAQSPQSSSLGSLKKARRSDAKYKVPDDGHKWQFGTYKFKGSVVCKRMACSVATCKAVRKVRYDVLHGNALLSDRCIGRHNH